MLNRMNSGLIGNAMNLFLPPLLLLIMSVLSSAPANAAVVGDVNSNCDVLADTSKGGTVDGEEEPECD